MAVGVYENRRNCNYSVKDESYNKEIGVRSDFIYIAGNNISSTGRSIASKAYTVNNATDNTA